MSIRNFQDTFNKQISNKMKGGGRVVSYVSAKSYFSHHLEKDSILEKVQKPYNHGHDISTLNDIVPNTLLPQMKRSVVIGNDNGVFEMPHKLPSNLRLRILEN